MTFKDINLHKGYNSDNIISSGPLHKFYIPALSTSKEYWRLTGYFSSGSIRAAAVGIRQLIHNKGTMKLITGLEFSSEDKKAIEEGVESIENKITQKMSKIIDEELKDEDFTLQPAKVLGYMLKKGILEIKIIDVTGTGIGHPKVGIMFDEERNSISFSGSNNETGSGWLNNIEEFKVFKEFENVESEFYNIDKQMFSNFWHGITQRCTVYDLPGPIIDRLIEMAPEEIESLDVGYDDGITIPVQPLSIENDLWTHQKIAIQAWLSPNDWQSNLDTELSDYLQNQSTQQPTTTNRPNQGIFAMATGSGKTRTAVAASLYAPNEVITIVALPLTILSQWEDEIKSWLPENLKIIYAKSSGGNWEQQLPSHLGVYRLGSPPSTLPRLFILGSYDTISSDRFVSLFDGIASKFVQFIGDEVHNFGTEKRDNAFKIKADRIMGLSATHTRHWDDPGTTEIETHFGEPIYEFNIQDGIDHERLCPYNYHIHFVPLTATELEDYRVETSNQGLYHYKIKTSTGGEKARYQSLLQTSRNVRSRILRKAENKPGVVAEILENHFCGDTEKAIIFVEDKEQLEHTEKVLNNQNKLYFVYHSGLTPAQRTTALRDFKEAKTSRFLLGKKMLDEGLDVPDSDKCILVASTTNPRQYIQRRGRVLRISPNNPNKLANIHDAVVVPDYSVPSGSLSDAEESKAIQMGKIISKEIQRIDQLNSSASNQNDVKLTLKQYITSHNLQNYVIFNP